MANNEFKTYNEINKISEFQKSKNELFIKKDLNDFAPELAKTGNEYTTESKNISKDKETGFSKIIEKVGSTTSIVVTSVVGVCSAVVILTTIILQIAKIQVLNLNVTENSISFDLSLTDVENDLKYYLKLTKDDFIYEKELTEGVNRISLNNLDFDAVYHLKVYSMELLEEKIYFEQIIQTLKPIEEKVIPYELKEILIIPFENSIQLKYDISNELAFNLRVLNNDTNEVYYPDGDTIYIDILDNEILHLTSYLVEGPSGDEVITDEMVPGEDEIIIEDTKVTFEIDPKTENVNYTLTLYPEPFDFLTTYNDDQSINLYAITDYYTEDQELQFSVILENSNYEQSRYLINEQYIKMENIPSDTYYVYYEISKTIGNTKYLYEQYYPMSYEPINPNIEPIVNINYDELSNLVLDITDNLGLNENTIKLRNEQGDLFDVLSDDISYVDISTTDNAEYVYRISNIDLNNFDTTLWIIMDICQANSIYSDLEGSIEIKGNQYKQVEISLNIPS